MKRGRHTCTFVAMLLLTVQIAWSQNLDQQLSSYFSETASDDDQEMLAAILVAASTPDVFPLLDIYLSDSIPAIRADACMLVHALITGSTDKAIRQAGVETLLRNYGVANHVNTSALILAYLQKYFIEDFSTQAINRLKDLIRSEAVHLDRLLKLAGFLGVKELIPDIRPWTQPGNSASLRWAALLSMTRMGDKTATAQVIDRVKSLPLNDDVVYHIFPDLIYTRAAEAIAHVIKALHDGEEKCFTADPEHPAPMPCGYRIMELLAPAIEGFPIVLDISGDLETDDYKTALTQVQNWFKNNKAYRVSVRHY